eukprot:366663_1
MQRHPLLALTAALLAISGTFLTTQSLTILRSRAMHHQYRRCRLVLSHTSTCSQSLTSTSKSNSSTSLRNANGLTPENESPEERSKRMEMVRQLQKSFYQNEEMVQREDDSTTILDLP